MIISITTVGRNLPSKPGNKRFHVPEGALDDARTAADVLAVVRRQAPGHDARRDPEETNGSAIKRIVEAESKPGNGGVR